MVKKDTQVYPVMKCIRGHLTVGKMVKPAYAETAMCRQVAIWLYCCGLKLYF